jgi:surface polysaccharide O-acyltransferase-like enzyme
MATAVTIIGTYLLTRASGQFDNFFYYLISLNVILASAAAFLLLRKISEGRLFTFPKARDLLRLLASCAFGIYLVHVVVIEVLQGWIPGIHLDSLIGNPIWSIPLVVAIVFGISFLIVRVLQKVPVLNHIVP